MNQQLSSLLEMARPPDANGLMQFEWEAGPMIWGRIKRPLKATEVVPGARITWLVDDEPDVVAFIAQASRGSPNLLLCPNWNRVITVLEGVATVVRGSEAKQIIMGDRVWVPPGKSACLEPAGHSGVFEILMWSPEGCDQRLTHGVPIRRLTPLARIH